MFRKLESEMCFFVSNFLIEFIFSCVNKKQKNNTLYSTYKLSCFILSSPLCTYNIHPDIVSLFSKEGSSISLECHLQDVNERSSVKWLKDGSQVLSENDGDAENSHRFKMEMGKHFKLTILQVTSDDAGLYDCAHFSDEDRFKIKSARRYRLFVDGSLRLYQNIRCQSFWNFEIGGFCEIG